MTVLFVCISAALLLQLLYPAVVVLIARSRTSWVVPPSSGTPLTLACIITAYRNVDIARPLVQSLLQQTYPNLRIYLVADECPDFDFGILDERFHPLVPEQPLRLKVKSIRYAMDRLAEQPDYVVIFDADNVAHPDFLRQLTPWMEAGYKCVQGQRTAKNLDTTYAALDSLGEHYKNFLERETAFRLGSSAVISGSGMATQREFYEAYLQSEDILLGSQLGKKMLQEDKILQNFLLRQNVRIAYARQALLYDEKVSKGQEVETQRSRWLYSYFQNIPNALGLMARGLMGGSFNQCYFGAMTLVLPMFLQVGLALLLCMAGWWISPLWSVLLALGLLVFFLNVLWVLHLDKAPRAVKRAVWQAPLFVFRQIKALVKMTNPNRNFRHTDNRQTMTVEEVLRDRESQL